MEGAGPVRNPAGKRGCAGRRGGRTRFVSGLQMKPYEKTRIGSRMYLFQTSREHWCMSSFWKYICPEDIFISPTQV
jgi:hypothetical protein